MVIRQITRGALLLVFFLLIPRILPAENRSTVELSFLNSLNRISTHEWYLSTAGTGIVDFDSVKNENVRAQFSIETIIGETVLLNIKRASLKIRFPNFRLLTGKARVSWGEGFYYNAGDIVYDTEPAVSDLTAEELRDEAVWLTTIFIPLGTFSFFEGIILPQPINPQNLVSGIGEYPAFSDTGIGGRVLIKVAEIQLQSGYVYKGKKNQHTTFVSLQGHLLTDFFLATRLSFPDTKPTFDDVKNSLEITAGLYHLPRLPYFSDFAMRLEGLIRPASSWSETSTVTEYGLMLYPEVSWQVNDALTLISRNFVSPIDRSLLTSVGVKREIYDGFTILLYLFSQAGETADVYGFEREGGMGLNAGFNYVY